MAPGLGWGMAGPGVGWPVRPPPVPAGTAAQGPAGWAPMPLGIAAWPPARMAPPLTGDMPLGNLLMPAKVPGFVARVIVGQSSPPIPAKVVERIWRGAHVDLNMLLPHRLGAPEPTLTEVLQRRARGEAYHYHRAVGDMLLFLHERGGTTSPTSDQIYWHTSRRQPTTSRARRDWHMMPAPRKCPSGHSILAGLR